MRILSYARILVLAVVVAALMAPATALAVDRPVCGACTYTTIQAAIDAAGPGDVVVLGAGTWTEALTVTDAITIRGAGTGVNATSRTGTASESVIAAPVGAIAIDAYEDLVLDGVYVDASDDSAIDTNSSLVLRDSVVTGLADMVVVAGAPSLLIDRSRLTRAGSGSSVLTTSVASVTVTASSFTASTGTTDAVEIGTGAVALSVLGNSFDNFDRAVTIDLGVSGGPFVVRRNRIDGSTSAADGVSSSSVVPVDATDNWWGCIAEAPSLAGACPVVAGTGTINTSPYLTMAVGPAVVPVPGGTTTPVLARLVRNDGSAVPDGAGIPDGIGIEFSASKSGDSTYGSLTPRTPTTVGGVATSIYLPDARGGVTTFKAELDDVTVSTPVEVRGPTPSVVQAAQIVGGPPRFATTLSCSTSWNRNTGSTHVHQWLRNGAAIAGATTTSYVVARADVGAKITCSDTISFAFTDPVTSTSAPVTGLKRRITLALFQTSLRGVVMRCGTVRKPCVHKLPAALYMKVGEHASHFKGLKVKVVLERKIGRRWVVAKTQVATVTLKPFAVSTRLLAKGSYRARVTFGPSATDLLAASAYRYLTIR